MSIPWQPTIEDFDSADDYQQWLETEPTDYYPLDSIKD